VVVADNKNYASRLFLFSCFLPMAAQAQAYYQLFEHEANLLVVSCWQHRSTHQWNLWEVNQHPRKSQKGAIIDAVFPSNYRYCICISTRIPVMFMPFFACPEKLEATKVIIIFVLIVSIILVNLLVAQLNQAYQHVYTDMQGHFPGAGECIQRHL